MLEQLCLRKMWDYDDPIHILRQLFTPVMHVRRTLSITVPDKLW